LGLREFFWREPLWKEKAIDASPAVLEAVANQQASFTPLLGMGPHPHGGQNTMVTAAYIEAQSAAYAHMYRTQPAVRMVIDFIARNVAQLALRLYERSGDNERKQHSDHKAARAMRDPNPATPGEQLIFNYVADYLIHDNAYIVKLRPNVRLPVMLYGLPAHRVGVLGRDFFTPEGYRIWRADGSWRDEPVENVIHWRGYNPCDPRLGISPLETLRKVLAEDAALQQANVELAKQGFAPPGYISRPLEAPAWSSEGAERFREGWANQQTDSGRHTPVLEEGMEFHDFGFTPKDAQVLDGRRFTVEQVAAIYGVPVELLTGKPSEAAQRQFYQDVLPPICELACAYLDLGLLQEEYNLEGYYFEFDLDEKLQGDSRITALVSAAGAPVMLRNEARAKLNLPPVEGGDKLVTPLNVMVGDPSKPSPMVMPPQDPNKPPQDGSHRTAASNGDGKYSPSQPRDHLGRWTDLLGLGDVPPIAIPMTMRDLGLDPSDAATQRVVERLRDGEEPDEEEPELVAKIRRALANLHRRMDANPFPPYVTVHSGEEMETKSFHRLIKSRAAKMQRREHYAGQFTAVLRTYYGRQERAVRQKSGQAKAFDFTRWVRELTKDLLDVIFPVVEREGQLAARRFATDFDLKKTEKYLTTYAEGVAEAINRTTRDQLAEKDVAEVFKEAKTNRAETGGRNLATKMTSWAELEAAQQSPDRSRRKKRWVVTSENSEHPEMNGEVRELEEHFSNGLASPPYEHIGCQCIVEVT
jgi:HK97 family phage portal protein